MTQLPDKHSINMDRATGCGRSAGRSRWRNSRVRCGDLRRGSWETETNRTGAFGVTGIEFDKGLHDASRRDGLC